MAKESRSGSSQARRKHIIIGVTSVFIVSMAARWWSEHLSPTASSPVLVAPARPIQTLPPGEEPRLRILEVRGGVGENDREKTVVVVVRLVLEGNERVIVDLGYFSRVLRFQFRHAMALVSRPAFEEFTQKDNKLIQYARLPFTFEPFAPIELAFDCGAPRMDEHEVDETLAMVHFHAPHVSDRLYHLARSKRYSPIALKWDEGLGVRPLPRGFPKLPDGITVLPPDGSKPFKVRPQIDER